MRNIILIGMMGCGKTTVGKLLASRLKRTLVDTDALIERQEGMTVREIFATQGEAYFRAVETGVAQAVSLRSDLIISCGGGLPMQEGAMKPLKESGLVVWLDRDPADIFDTEDMTGRPMAKDGRAAFLALAEKRRPVYESWADVTVTDFTSPISTAARVLEVLK